MSFFLRGGKRKKPQSKPSKQGKPSQTEGGVGKRRRKARLDEEIESSSEVDSDEEVERRVYSSEEEDDETAQDKKLRTAKAYLEKLKEEESRRQELEEVSHDAISHRLQQDDLEKAGKLHKNVADQYTCPDPSTIDVLRGHQLSVTCAVASTDGMTAFSSSKDGSIIKWCLASKKKLYVIRGGRKGTESTHIGHTDCVLCLAISSDGKYLASGDVNKLIHIWDPSTCQLLHTFRGHRKSITGLVFRKNTHQLFSASADHTVKVWNLDEMAYVETLYGHEEGVMAVDSLLRDRAVTVGRDRLVHIFKVPEESAMKFAKHLQSDCVAFINESSFITGTDDNCLCLWSVMKKKPIFTVRNAHSGLDGQTTALGENWITAVAALPFTDLVASAGSKDGAIRLWKCENSRTLTPLFSIPMPGFVNSLQFSSKGDFLIAGVGQEHRMGRWWRLKQARNSVCFIPLPKVIPSNGTNGDDG